MNLADLYAGLCRDKERAISRNLVAELRMYMDHQVPRDVAEIALGYAMAERPDAPVVWWVKRAATIIRGRA